MGVYDQESHSSAPPPPRWGGAIGSSPITGVGVSAEEQAIILARALKALDDDDIDRAEALLEGLLAKGYPEFNPAQARVPAGDPSGRGGQWSGGGGLGGGLSRLASRQRGDDGFRLVPLSSSPEGGALRRIGPWALEKFGRGVLRGTALGRVLDVLDVMDTIQDITTPRADRQPSILDDNFLDLEEEYGGHPVSNHIDKDIDFLEGRLHDEPDIDKASTWDKPTATRVVRNAILSHDGEIKEWLSNTKDKRMVIIVKPGSDILGYALERGTAGLKPQYGAIVVLRRVGKNGYFVRTAYPD